MSKRKQKSIGLESPKNTSSKIKVIGVGGGGCNAVNYMFQAGIGGAELIVCNTDAEALKNIRVPHALLIGQGLTEGLGAGANPKIGEQAALENVKDIKSLIDKSTELVIIIAGMGGGTGTGAAPVIARTAKEMGILTMGIVTTPFKFEGAMRNELALIGIKKLRANVDSLMVIDSNYLRETYGNLGFKASYSKINEIISAAVNGITSVIKDTQNFNFNEVLAKSETAILGFSTASGRGRAGKAITKALKSPLLYENNLKDTKNLYVLITSGNQQVEIDEIGEINDYLYSTVGEDTHIFVGVSKDEGLEESIAITVVAAGPDFKFGEVASFENIEDSEILASNQKSNDIPKSQVAEIRYNLDDYLLIDEGLSSTSLLEELYGSKLIDSDTISKLDVMSSDENKAIQVFIENREKNKFLKKEVMFILFMASFALFYLFILNKERNIISFTSVFLSLVLVSLKLFLIFSKKAKDYNELIVNVVKHSASSERHSSWENLKVSEEKSEDPFNQSISSLLKERADERRRKLKNFNYKFQNYRRSIDEIENQPAYKRQGVDLNPKLSRTSLGREFIDEDQNEDSDHGTSSRQNMDR